MNEARKDGTSILGKLRPNLAAHKGLQGQWVVVRHPGLGDDGFDCGWNLAGPFGYGEFPDEWFSGWLPLPTDD